MRPILFNIPGWDVRIHSYGVLIFVSCAAALAMAVWRARREKVDPNAVYELATWLFLGGVVGARVFYFIQHPEAFHHPSDLLRTWEGGNVFYGCILGGLTGSTLYWLRRPFPFLRMCDVAAPAVAIGAALGRIGCFLNGCCHGAAAELPWAVRFPAGSHAWVRQLNAGLIAPQAPASLPVHPTQLYAAAAGLIVLGLLLIAARRPRRPGELMAVLMIAYPLTRWPIEALRGDEPAVFAGMTWAQDIGVALLLGGLALRFRLRRHPLGRETGAARPPDPVAIRPDAPHLSPDPTPRAGAVEVENAAPVANAAGVVGDYFRRSGEVRSAGSPTPGATAGSASGATSIPARRLAAWRGGGGGE
jgi:phosphatidylglycerol:prolipoprotein diacylglycerol transferase